MLKLVRNGVALAAIVVAVQSYATVIPAEVDPNEKEATVLSLLNIKDGNQFLIKDSFGSILYQEKIKDSDEFIDRFNLTFLPDGEYSIELDKKKETVIIPLEIYDHQAELGVKSSYVRAKGKSSRSEDKIYNLERGIPKRTSSFKGGDYLKYLK